MRRLTAMVLAVCTIAGAAAAAGFDYFHETYADAEKAARKEDKPLYLHFTTTWCGWCRRIEDDVYKQAEGEKALSPFVSATLDCTVPKGQQPSKDAAFNMGLMRKYGGSGYPFLVMVTADGTVLHKISGYKPLPAFKAELIKAGENFQKLKAFDAYAAKADKAGYEYNAKALEFYSDTGSWDKAAEAAAALKKLDPKYEKGRAAAIGFALLQAAGSDDKAKLASLEDDVVKHDSKNESGYLEKVLLGRAFREYRQVGRNPDKEVQKEGFGKAVDALNLLTTQAEKLTDGAQVYGFLGFLNMQLGNNEQAVAAMNKAIELDPSSRRAASLKNYIEQMKKAKDGE